MLYYIFIKSNKILIFIKECFLVLLFYILSEGFLALYILNIYILSMYKAKNPSESI